VLGGARQDGGAHVEEAPDEEGKRHKDVLGGDPSLSTIVLHDLTHAHALDARGAARGAPH
jgi:hypothetical protein